MKISELWLREWVNPELAVNQIAEQLTMAGLEVDSLVPVAGSFSGVIVAEVMSTKPHPQADRLTLCTVNDGSETPLSIVCGAANVRPGLKVALAKIGAQLPGNLQIKETKLRGELSQGMLCSTSELGMTEKSEGIMELDKQAPLGQDLRTYLQLDDHIIEVDLTPNRADCFSLQGVAREVAALNRLPLKPPVIQAVQPQTDEVFKVRVSASKACPAYLGRVIKNIDPTKETPLWMAERLRRSGLRLVHPVVDVTNYVMIELGQPMHAFDLRALKGGIEVRFAKNGEQMTLLDGQEVVLNDRVLLIADEQKPLALAGIMGGEGSAVQSDTVDLFLESAYFNPLSISGVARQFGLCTDSSQRFERGVDPQIQRLAMERATSLLLEIVGGQAGALIEVIEAGSLPEEKKVELDPEKVSRLSGLAVDKATIVESLSALGMVVENPEAEILKVKIPSYRFDVSLDVDLVEDIIRLYGYDKLPTTAIASDLQAGKEVATETQGNRCAALLASRGYHEIISYSFVDPQLQRVLYPDAESLQLVNPISSELSEMRLGLWPGLIAAMLHNAHRQQQAIKLFETGVRFSVEKGQLSEIPCLAGLITGEYGYLNWAEKQRDFDFYDLKGDVEALLSQSKLGPVEFVARAHPALHPGQSAAIMSQGFQIGWIGVLHPRLSDELDLAKEVILFELDLTPLEAGKASRYQQISRFPLIRRDLSFLVDKDISAAAIAKTVRAAVPNHWLKSFDIFDLYLGEGIPEGKKSLAVAITLQDATRTLVDSEINELISAIIKSLETDFAILLRD